MSTNRRKFDREFKLRVIERSFEVEKVTDLAKELGIRPELIYRWRSELANHGKSKSFPGNGNKAMSEEEREIDRLRKELADVKLEHEILKKANRHLLQERREKFKFIMANVKFFPVEKMCKVLKVSRQGYYRWLNRPPSKRELENAELTRQIKKIHTASRQSYGAPRITQTLRMNGYRVSLPRVERLMRKAGVKSKYRRKYVLTTDSLHNFRRSPNLLQRQFQPGQISRAWVSDITFIRTDQGWLFLTVIIDLGDRRVIGWSMSKVMTAQDTVVAAFRMAMNNRKPQDGTIFHSDQGVQYACEEFRTLLAQISVFRQSMSRKGDCWDNAVAEAFFKGLKTEVINGVHFPTRNHAERVIFEYIEIWYNRARLHQSLGYRSPQQYLESIINAKVA
ncbi:MAG: IS3 family transposase [Bacteroidia bacterium]|nr:IS3 family transposase [Bacteroidia bacterium]